MTTGFLIYPQYGEVTPFGYDKLSSVPEFQGLVSMIEGGHCTTLTLPNGDLIIAGPEAVGPIGASGERFERLKAQGGFALLKDAPTDKMLAEGFQPDNDLILAEIVGPAILVGPTPEGGALTTFTPARTTERELARSLGFNRYGLDLAPLRNILAQLLDSDEGEFRTTLTDEQLAECWPGRFRP